MSLDEARSMSVEDYASWIAYFRIKRKREEQEAKKAASRARVKPARRRR